MMMVFSVITARGFLPGCSAMYTAGLEEFFGVTSSHHDQNHALNYNEFCQKYGHLNNLLRPKVCVVHLISDIENCVICHALDLLVGRG